MDQVTSVIVHYNTPVETVACLRSLVASKLHDFHHQIVVIDNGSKDAFILPKDLSSNAKITLVRSDSNLGFAGGNNLGIRYAISNFNCDFLILLNSDAVVSPQTIAQLVDAARSKPSLGLINPKIYFSKNHEYHAHSYQQKDKGHILWFAGGTTDWADLVSFHRGVDEVDRMQFDLSTQTDFATGCCLLIRREVIETVGVLNENLFLYWEDVEYSLRVKAKGYQIGLVPMAEAWHDNAGSSDGAGNVISLYYQTRNRLYMAFTWGNWQAKRTAIRLVWQLIQRSGIEQRAAFDAIIGRMGKQALA